MGNKYIYLRLGGVSDDFGNAPTLGFADRSGGNKLNLVAFFSTQRVMNMVVLISGEVFFIKGVGKSAADVNDCGLGHTVGNNSTDKRFHIIRCKM